MKVTHFEKVVKVEGDTQYGYIKMFFGHAKKTKVLPRLSFEKFVALSSLLKDHEVFYNAKYKIFHTNTETQELESFFKELEIL